MVNIGSAQTMNTPANIASAPVAKGSLQPPFWDDFLHKIPFCVLLEQQFDGILEEIQRFIHAAHPFMDYPKYGNLYSKSWEAFPLSIFENEFINSDEAQLDFNLDQFVAQARSQLPVTSALLSPLETQGHLRNVFVSRLLPGSEIRPHRGRTLDFLRIHLGLVCDPLCQITVDTCTRTWELGKLLAFRDGGPYPHSVSHRGTQERIVMSVDLRISYIAQFIPSLQV